MRSLSTRAYTFVLLGQKTGMRRGEILDLKWDCIDFDNSIISVRRNLVFTKGKPTLENCAKAKAVIRDIPISPEISEYLRSEKAVTNSMFVVHQLNGEMMSQSSFRSLWEIVTARMSGPETTGTRRHPEVRRTIEIRYYNVVQKLPIKR